MLPVRAWMTPGCRKANRRIDRVLPEPLVDEAGRTRRDRLVELLEGPDRDEFERHADALEIVAHAFSNRPMNRVVLDDALEGEALPVPGAPAVFPDDPAGRVEQATRFNGIEGASPFDYRVVVLAAG
jgi:hypothetical protein